MILKRLYELAAREKLLADPAFDDAPIACLINIAADGTFLGLQDIRPRTTIAPKRPGGKPSIKIARGKPTAVPVRPVVLSAPKAKHGEAERPASWKVTDPAASGAEKPAVFLADTLPRVLPIRRLIDPTQQAKFEAQRSTFWRFVRHVAAATNDDALNAIVRFAELFQDNPAAEEEFAVEVEKYGLKMGHLCTFIWQPDAGKLVLERPAIRDWWRQFFAQDRAAQETEQFRGLCQVTGEVTAIADSIKVKVNGLTPIGCLADAYLVSAVPASESHNLSGACTGMVSAQAVDGYTRALNALIANSLPDSPRSGLRVGKVQFLFWTRQKTDEDDVSPLDRADPEEVERLINAARSGQQSFMDNDNEFYCLALSGNSARIVVRDYLETPLSKARHNLGHWFSDLKIADATFDGQGLPKANFPLWMLTTATARESGDVAPDLPAALMHAALKRQPLPDSVLAACLRRLRVEHGPQQFRPSRMALIKLCLNRSPNRKGDSQMPEILDPTRTTDRAYVCGRLLAFLALCQSRSRNERDVGESASILDRYFSSASMAPRTVMPTLLRLNRRHLSTIRDANIGSAVNLEKELDELLLPLDMHGSDTPDFPAILSLAEQGRFALGFYHQRAAYRRESSEKKAARALKAAEAASRSDG